MSIHLPGERRRNIALASTFNLFLYLLLAGIAQLTASSGIGHSLNHFLSLTGFEQGIVVGLIWLGFWLIANAQRELIAHREGSYALLQTITDVRGMRWVGLFFGVVTLAIVALVYLLGSLTPQFGVTGILITVTLLTLGAPDSPSRRYHVMNAHAQSFAPITTMIPTERTPQRVIDAGPNY
jgi:hypothetical protein